MPHIVKRRGHTEPFDSRKIYAAVFASCRNAHLSEMLSENIADSVQNRLEEWVEDKQDVTSEQIFRETITVLKALHPDAAFLFETHRDIS